MKKLTSKEYDCAFIGAIISDCYMKQLYKQYGSYVECLDYIAETTQHFCQKFEKEMLDKATDWCEVAEKHDVCAYDDLVMKITGEYLADKHKIKLRIPV